MNLSRFYLGLHLKPIICRILWDFSCRIDVRHDIIPDSCVGTGNSCYEGIGKQGALLFGASDASCRKRLGAKCCSIGLARAGNSLDVCPSLSWWAAEEKGALWFQRKKRLRRSSASISPRCRAFARLYRLSNHRSRWDERIEAPACRASSQ